MHLSISTLFSVCVFSTLILKGSSLSRLVPTDVMADSTRMRKGTSSSDRRIFALKSRPDKTDTINFNVDDPLISYSSRSKLIEGLSDALRLTASMSLVFAASFLPFPSIARAQSSLEAANSKLASYGLPPVLFAPPGFSTVVSEFGRGGLKDKLTNPLLVQFSYPSLWVCKTTNVNNNGEAGTISAGDYIKGDSAYFYTSPFDSSMGENKSLDVDNVQLIKAYIFKSLSQKGKDIVDNVAVQSVKKGTSGVDGQQYLSVDFSYDLNTEAGFLISRRGTMSVSSVGGSLQSVAAVTTKKRYKELGPVLRDIADSFRVYKLNSGVFSTTSPART